VGKIDLGGKPEFAATDEKGTVFVNIEDTSELVASIRKIDGEVALETGQLRRTDRLGDRPEEPPSICRLWRKQEDAIVDADSGKVLATPAIGEGCDATAFDADRGSPLRRPETARLR